MLVFECHSDECVLETAACQCRTERKLQLQLVVTSVARYTGAVTPEDYTTIGQLGSPGSATAASGQGTCGRVSEWWVAACACWRGIWDWLLFECC